MEFMAILRRRTESFTEKQFEEVLEAEAEAVRSLYIQGVVRGIWSRGDHLGAVTLLEAGTLEEARTIVDGFPLAQRGMLEVQHIIPLRGYRGFGPRG